MALENWWALATYTNRNSLWALLLTIRKYYSTFRL